MKNELNAMKRVPFMNTSAPALKTIILAVEQVVEVVWLRAGLRGGTGEEKTRSRDGNVEARSSNSMDRDGERPVRWYLPVAGLWCAELTGWFFELGRYGHLMLMGP